MVNTHKFTVALLVGTNNLQAPALHAKKEHAAHFPLLSHEFSNTKRKTSTPSTGTEQTQSDLVDQRLAC